MIGEYTDLLPDLRPKKYKIDFSKIQSTSTKFTISLRKLSTAEPFAPGIATFVFKASTFEFYGVETVSTILNDPPKQADHKIQFLGASDTAGYCVDGTPKTNFLEEGLLGWKYEDCNSGYVSLVGQAFEADIEVFAISGIGLTQNARTK